MTDPKPALVVTARNSEADQVSGLTRAYLPLADYDLAATLTSGQAFRWNSCGSAWEGVVMGRWVRLEAVGDQLSVEVAEPVPDWTWLKCYLGLCESLPQILASFPQDEPMAAAINACRGLRLLRQEPWECLASFILSSTKQIVQIRQCVALLSERFGEPLPVPAGKSAAYSFPTWNRLAALTELDLRACKLGFRARYLADTSRALAAGRLDLDRLWDLPTAVAREQLMQLPGVGPKIANCVLLFAFGRQDAFPVDVWVLRALRELYYPRRRPKPRTLLRFTESYFGPNAGYAQQYLFHYVRTKHGARNEKRGARRGVSAAVGRRST